MKIALEGTSEEVIGMMAALVGVGAVLPSTPGVEVAEIPAECPQIFEDLVRAWVADFDGSGTAHWDNNEPIKPDKGEKLRALAAHRTNGKVLKWIEGQGGLTHAINTILGDTKLSRSVAMNMSQVGSILFNDITLLLEHYDPFEDE